MNTYSLIGSSSAGSCFHAGSSDVIHSGSDVISSIFHSCIFFFWRRVNMTDDGAGRRTSSYRTGWMAGAQIACSACSSPFTTNCAWTFPTRTTCFGLTQYFTEIITYLATCFFPPVRCDFWAENRLEENHFQHSRFQVVHSGLMESWDMSDLAAIHQLCCQKTNT